MVVRRRDGVRRRFLVGMPAAGAGRRARTVAAALAVAVILPLVAATPATAAEPPDRPRIDQLQSSPGGTCARSKSPAWTNAVPTLYAAGLTDPDEGQLAAEFAVDWTGADGVTHHWSSAENGAWIFKQSGPQSLFSVKIPSDAIQRDTMFSWRVRAYDGTAWSPWSSDGDGRPCFMIYDPQAPSPPVITSNAADGYTESDPSDPQDPWQDGVGRYGRFELTFDPDVAKYAYALNTDPSSGSARARRETTESIWVVPIRSGPTTLYVRVWDRAGNSSVATYVFRVSAGVPEKAHWRLDDAAGAGELTDSAPKGDGSESFPAVVGGDVTLGEPGIDGTAARLAGSGYAATTGKVVDTTDDFAVAAWVRLAGKDNSSTVIAQEGSHGAAFALRYSTADKRWVFGMRDTKTNAGEEIIVASAADATVNQWTHLAGTYDHITKQITLYVNGERQGQPVAQPHGWVAGGPLSIGRLKVGGAYPDDYRFTGDLDEVRVYDRIVPPDELERLATVEPEIAGRWRLNTASGTPATTADSAPVATPHPMTLSGAAAISTDPAKAWVWPSDGSAPGALDLPGGDGDYATVDAPVADTSMGFTVAAWVRTADLPERSMTVLSLGGTTNSAIVVRYDAARRRYVLDIPSADTAGAPVASVEHSGFHTFMDWDHIAVVYDAFNSRVTLYVNGWAEAKTEVTTGSSRDDTRVFSPITSLELGRAKSDGAYPTGHNWTGQIDDVWVLRGVASQEQISLLSSGIELEDI